MQVKNSSGEDTRENVTVSSTEEVDLAGSRGTAHFAIKWVRDARSQANLNVVEDIKGVALQYTGQGIFHMLLVLCVQSYETCIKWVRNARSQATLTVVKNSKGAALQHMQDVPLLSVFPLFPSLIKGCATCAMRAARQSGTYWYTMEFCAAGLSRTGQLSFVPLLRWLCVFKRYRKVLYSVTSAPLVR